jgi:hypothetical protein
VGETLLATMKTRKAISIGDIPAKLLWTSRLFDALEKRVYWIKSKPYERSNLREAEIVPSCAGGIFPNGFDWKILTKHLSCQSGAIQFYQENTWFRPDREKYGRFTEYWWSTGRYQLGEQVVESDDFHVLWLSPSVFISPWWFEMFTDVIGRAAGWDSFLDFRFEVRVRDTKETFQFYAYSLSTFEDKHVPPRQHLVPPLALQLFQHVCESLPKDYFSEIVFEKGTHHFPSENFVPFFAGLRLQVEDDSASRPRTKVRFRGDEWHQQVTREDLKILAGLYHPKVDLSFNVLRQSSSISDLSKFLQGSSPPGYLAVRRLNENIYNGVPGHDHCPVTELFLESPALKFSFRACYSPCSRNSLLEILKTHQIRALKVVIPWFIWRDDRENDRESIVLLLLLLLEEDSLLERLTVVVDYNNDSRESWNFPRLVMWWAEGTTPCKSKNLRVCHVSFRGYNIHAREYDRRKSPLQGIKRWDEVMAPALVLNFYRNVVSSPVTSGIVPVAVQSINAGNVYQKTTNHIPYDVRIANSGLIFQIVRGMGKQTI